MSKGSTGTAKKREAASGRATEEAPAATDGGGGWRFLWIGGGLLLLHLGLLLAVFQPAPHSGGDNAAYLALGHALAEGSGYIELWEPGAPDHAKYPPVFPAVLAVATLLGAVTWPQLKLVPLAFVALSVLAVFAWVYGRRGALFAVVVAGLVAVSDAFLAASHWILSEPPFVAFVLLSLWAADRAGPGRWRDDPASEKPVEPPAGRWDGPLAWTAAAGGLALLAYFTRGAGLPLVAAFLGWLVLRRAWRPLALFVPAFALPALLWWLRGRRVGEDDYASEFWMADPYRPEAGEAGAIDLAARAGTNLWAYVSRFFPEGLVGADGAAVSALGMGLVLLAGWGWLRRLRAGPGLAELFAPLYLALILVWPEVWSGDRFALPLYPLLLFYGGEALLHGARAGWSRIAGAGQEGSGRALAWSAGAASVLVLALPALGAWTERVQETSACRSQVERGGAWACQPATVAAFAEAAEWSGANLPDGSVVVSRKPRIFHLLSGLPGRMYPLSPDPGRLLAEMDAAGASYLMLGWVDGLAIRYLQPAIAGRPEAFCHVAGWGEGEGAANLLGLAPPEAREPVGARRDDGGTVAVQPCGDDFLRDTPREREARSGLEVPLLVGYERRRP